MTDKKTHVERVMSTRPWRWLLSVFDGAPPDRDDPREMLITIASRLDAAEAELARRDAEKVEAEKPEAERATTTMDELHDAARRAVGKLPESSPGSRGILPAAGDAWIVRLKSERIEDDVLHVRTWQRTYRVGATESQIAADLRAALKALEGMS